MESFLGDVAEILREEVAELIRLGATYIQLDAPHYPLLIDPAYREFYESRGWPADRWIELGTELDDVVIADHPGVVFGFHPCRGNQLSRWLVSGGYDWLAGRLFLRVRAERLLLEYDDERSGSFDALASVPEDKTVVLGLVTTKTGRVETVDELSAGSKRLHGSCRSSASPSLPNAGSPPRSGGIRSPGNTSAKLRTIAETAVAIWGAR